MDQQQQPDEPADFALLGEDGSTAYGRCAAGEELRAALRRHLLVSTLGTMGARRLRMWFSDTFTADMGPNHLADKVIGALGYHHPTGWYGPVALTMEENAAGDIPPLSPEVRATVDELTGKQGTR